jgi:hypothetical protein
MVNLKYWDDIVYFLSTYTAFKFISVYEESQI